MATPIKVTKASSSSNHYVVVLVKLLLIVLILLWLAPLVQSRPKRKRRIKIKQQIQGNRVDCELECVSQIPEEAMNCIHECMSHECYTTIYGSEPLEPGEIDLTRATELDQCMQQEIKEMRQKERAERRNVANPRQDEDEKEDEAGEGPTVEM
jgi:hypothetical protein